MLWTTRTHTQLYQKPPQSSAKCVFKGPLYGQKAQSSGSHKFIKRRRMYLKPKTLGNSHRASTRGGKLWAPQLPRTWVVFGPEPQASRCPQLVVETASASYLLWTFEKDGNIQNHSWSIPKWWNVSGIHGPNSLRKFIAEHGNMR